jgi:hypothetical protein
MRLSFKWNIHLPAILLMGIMCGACEKEIPFEGDIAVNKLVVNGLMQSDTVFSVHVSESLSVIDNGQLMDVTNATVTILDDAGNTITTLQHAANGFYYGAPAVFPAIQQNYTIHAYSPGFTEVSSVSSVPIASPIAKIDTGRTDYMDYDDVLEFIISIDDSGDSDNFYAIRLTGRSFYFDGTDTIWYESNLYYLTMDPVFDNNNRQSDFETFRDYSFNGQSVMINLGLPDYSNGSYTEFRVYLYSLSESYYGFLSSRQLYTMANGDFFSQPVQVYSNINEGLGIWGGFSLVHKDL